MVRRVLQPARERSKPGAAGGRDVGERDAIAVMEDAPFGGKGDAREQLGAGAYGVEPGGEPCV